MPNSRMTWTSGGVAFHDEDFRTVGGRLRTVGKLAGQAELPRRRLAGDVLLLPPAQAFIGPVDNPFEELVCLLRRRGQPVVEMVAYGLFDQFRF